MMAPPFDYGARILPVTRGWSKTNAAAIMELVATLFRAYFNSSWLPAGFVQSAILQRDDGILDVVRKNLL
jgi:hypothetical protein